jgi:predicted  nucleic acid-binding Zn-ribbon protein
MSSLKNTVDKIKSLEEEKRNLLLEIESLRKQVDARANTLENEVGALREEVKSLKIIVSGPVPEPPVPNKIQI